MPRPKKRSGAETSRSTRQNKRQRIVPTDADDSKHHEASSVNSDLSDSEVTLVNSEGAVDLEVLNKSVKNAQKALEDNHARAKEFEEVVMRQQAKLREEIKTQEEQTLADQTAFEIALQPAILSALLPLTLKNTGPQSRDSFTMRASDIDIQGQKPFKDTETLCRSMTSLLSIYTALAERPKPDARTRTARNSLNKDKESVSQVIMAGTKRTTQNLDMRSTSAKPDNAVVQMSVEEERDSVLFCGPAEPSSVYSNISIEEWSGFTSRLAGAIREIEDLTQDTTRK